MSLFACLQMIVSHPLCGGLGGWCVLDLQNSHLHPPAKHKSATRPGQFMSCQISLLSGFRYYVRFSTRVCGGQKRSPHRLGTGPACHGISPPPSRHRKLQGSKGEARPVFHSLCSVHSTHQVTRKAKLKGRKKEAKRGTVAMARCCLCPPKLSRGAMQRLGFFGSIKGGPCAVEALITLVNAGLSLVPWPPDQPQSSPLRQSATKSIFIF